MAHNSEKEVMVKETRFLIEKLAAEFSVPLANLDLRSWTDYELPRSVVRLVRLVAYIPASEPLRLPADWWEALKERWFPAWALRRWPVVYKTYEAKALFPRLELPSGDRFEHIIYQWRES